MSALALVGDVILAAADTDLSPTGAAAPNLNLTLWSTITGFGAPLIVAVINQPRMAPFVRALITVAVSVGLAAITTALEGQITGTRWVTSTLLVLVAAIGTYQTLWKNVAPRIEAATTSPAGRRADPGA